VHRGVMTEVPFNSTATAATIASTVTGGIVLLLLCI